MNARPPAFAVLTRPAAFTVVTLVAALGLVGCGSDSTSSPSSEETTASSGGSEETDMEKAPDAEVCSDQATALDAPYSDSFPEDWPFPPETVVYDVEDRGDAGTIVSAISSAPFDDILSYLNNEVVDAGFEIEGGETEEHDAEAEWRGADFHGRWAIRESVTCPGETSIQVLAGAN